MNAACGATTTSEWKKGWSLRSGEFANLCFDCGSAYENSVFCDTFHLEESGWRECRSCNKHLHCGCIASKLMLEHLDYGGIGCTSCANNSQLQSVPSDRIYKDLGLGTADSIGQLQPPLVVNRLEDEDLPNGKLMQLGKATDGHMLYQFPPSQVANPDISLGQIKQEDFIHAIKEVGTAFQSLNRPLSSTLIARTDNSRPTIHQALAQSFVSVNPNAPSDLALMFPHGISESKEKEQSKATSSAQQGQKSRPLLPKPSKVSHSTRPEGEIRVARPPAEGRGRNQLLPRYWPRITDQELQQLSGDLNSTIVPLFEKVLSASDAGRIGRLVLPKACAEAYFPPISQSEGRPLRIQDVKGKEWTFQFRFWPNNNSRMYVLEGVTPCIQSMQLQAGDTVIFSRIDPEGKLVMGFRKAASSGNLQDSQQSVIPNGDTFLSDAIENLPSVSGYSGLLQSLRGSKEPHLNAVSGHLNTTDANIIWDKSDRQMLIQEKKKTRNIGSKSKRLLMHSDEAMELRVTWEEAQDLLRPPPSAKPSIVTIEDHDFEEYDEPPVLGKWSIFTAQPSGEHDQWAQCDNCSKWRRLPVDVLLPSRWTCADNVWDPTRCSCSASDELNPKELENLLTAASKAFKKRRTVEGHAKSAQECEPQSGLDALATAAVLGDEEPSTTKHPRHRPGCTCIVCIQPPSGKGKHKPTCTCNVCMTVRRRFKTLMMRKKKRQSDLEAEIAQRKNVSKEESDLDMTPPSLHGNYSEREAEDEKSQAGPSNGKAQIDLNCDPSQQGDMSGVSMMSLVQAASLPLDIYLKQNGLTSLMCDQQPSMGALSQAAPVSDDESLEHESTQGKEGNCDPSLD